jgi:hypothetical protein
MLDHGPLGKGAATVKLTRNASSLSEVPRQTNLGIAETLGPGHFR